MYIKSFDVEPGMTMPPDGVYDAHWRGISVEFVHNGVVHRVTAPIRAPEHRCQILIFGGVVFAAPPHWEG
jgi:hypothetical protein